jgi:hypothetical protein
VCSISKSKPTNKDSKKRIEACQESVNDWHRRIWPGVAATPLLESG